jgi:hypothetical protein
MVVKAHGEFFRTIRSPATMVVVAGLLRPRWRVEIEADAVVHSAPRASRGNKWQEHWGLKEAVWQSYRFAI